MSTTSGRVSSLLQTQIPISRKGFLTALGGFAVGAPAGAVAHEALRPAEPQDEGVRSYAQGGEDVAADFFFRYAAIGNVTYLDIGAFDPIRTNNTYYFYRKGCRGVLVEPNAVMCEKLRAVRPGDTTLVAGIGVTAQREADYYMMSDPAWNSFSRAEAEHQEEVTGKRISIKKVVKVPLLNINDVMQKYFGKAPTFLSIDAEGLHLAILKSIDFDRFRPPLICAETLVSGTRKMISETPEFMKTRGYEVRGGSFVNTLFVDSRLI
jgi:FkbM family methyltransferase